MSASNKARRYLKIHEYEVKGEKGLDQCPGSWSKARLEDVLELK
jgi:hypothetical protein